MSDNTDQRDFWTDSAGPIWVDQRAAMDKILAGVLEGTLNRAELQAGQSVLDIGCGAGTSTMAVADIIGLSGRVTGIDISRTLLKAAQDRTIGKANITFLDADAQSHPFGVQSADTIVSRFGVMFFEDSALAFKNLGSALRPNGVISFSAWGAIAHNPFFTLPAQISRQILGPVPKSDPDAPGPFAFRDPARIEGIAIASGLDAQIDVVDDMLLCVDGAHALAQTMCLIGPAHMALKHHNANEKMRAILLDALVDALGIYQTDEGIAIPARINYVTARKVS